MKPPTNKQKIFYKLFNYELSKNLTDSEAESFIENTLEGELSRKQIRVWEVCEEFHENFADPDFKEDYELKKPSETQFLKTFQEFIEDKNLKEKYASFRDFTKLLKKNYPELAISYT